MKTCSRPRNTWIAVIILVLLVLLAPMILWLRWYHPLSPLRAEDLSAAYTMHPEEAERLYTRQELVILGKWMSTGPAPQNETEIVVWGPRNPVRCIFHNIDDRNQFESSLVDCSHVVIKGRCVGQREGYVLLEDCHLLSPRQGVR